MLLLPTCARVQAGPLDAGDFGGPLLDSGAPIASLALQL